MFVDELEIYAKAGNGGEGVVRWRREKYKPNGGPAGGNGGAGGSIYIRGAKDLSLLSKYTGNKRFFAENGAEGRGQSQHGKDGDDYYIDLPVGATVTDLERNRVYRLEEKGETHKILLGGQGGLGNEYFKSSTNRTPQQSTKGKRGEEGRFLVELSLLVDVGLIGFPNAGKTTLLNTLTNATAKVGAYPFTTLEPHLGDLFGFILADIPGLVEGASGGKGLGHKFLRHVQKTKMLLHLISLESEGVATAYATIRNELAQFDPELTTKEEVVVLTKADLVNTERKKDARGSLEAKGLTVYVVSAETGEGIKELRDALTQKLQKFA